MQIGPYKLANPFILAPMAGVSEMPFRVLAIELGAAAAPTELVSAKGLLYGQDRTYRYLEHNPVIEHPFWVQIFGGDAASMADGAARAVDLGARIIDINMGCPVKKVTKNGAGSGLLCDPQRAADIVAAIIAKTNIPVTVKIRAGWDDAQINFIEVAQLLEKAGIAAIAMHARTRAQGYSGHANWQWIKALADAVRIPVIGNGDITCVADAKRMQEETNCAAVMIGRAALGNPWIFAQLTKGQALPTPAERFALIGKHLDAHLHFCRDVRQGIRRFRPHLMWYAHGLAGASQFRNHVTTIDDLGALLEACKTFFMHAHMQSKQVPIEFDTRGALG